jgi:hypothetical protein
LLHPVSQGVAAGFLVVIEFAVHIQLYTPSPNQHPEADVGAAMSPRLGVPALFGHRQKCSRLWSSRESNPSSVTVRRAGFRYGLACSAPLGEAGDL